MMHQGRRVKMKAYDVQYLDEAVPPVIVLVEVFTKWFESGGDGCHRGC